MEIKTNALLIRATDYGENDKIVTLLTECDGRLSASVKGVRKPSAKLKFAAQPFCFGEYILVGGGGRNTVVGCTEIESYYDLRCDVEKFYAACAVCAIAESITFEGQLSGEIFLRTVRALSSICCGDEGVELIKYIVFALDEAGYAISAGECRKCGGTPCGERVRFDMDCGAFSCHDCGVGVEASFSTYEILRAIVRGEVVGGNTEFSKDSAKRALRLLKEYFAYKTGNKLTALAEYIRMI